MSIKMMLQNNYKWQICSLKGMLDGMSEHPLMKPSIESRIDMLNEKLDKLIKDKELALSYAMSVPNDVILYTGMKSLTKNEVIHEIENETQIGLDLIKMVYNLKRDNYIISIKNEKTK